MTKPDFTEDRIYNDFPKMLGFIYGDIVGQMWACRVHLGFFQTKGDEFNKAASTRTVPATARMVPAPPTSHPCLLLVRVPKLAPGILRAAQAQCSAQRLLSSKPGPRQQMKDKASMSLSKSLCARFEHSRARNKQF